MTSDRPEWEEALRAARFLVNEEEGRRSAPGFVGFNKTQPGDRVLIAADTHTDPIIVDALATALRERSAHVDALVLDAGSDREVREEDDIDAFIRRGRPSDDPNYRPRRYDSVAWVDRLAADQYDLLIHAKSGPYATGCRAEGLPWCSAETFVHPATTYPRDLHELINHVGWEPIWQRGKGARLRFRDPEGTDVSYRIAPQCWEQPNWGFNETPCWGHLMYHPPPPVPPGQDARGVIAGTVAHFCRPFPQISAYLDGGPVTRLEGGGAYGDAWRDLLEETGDTQYPCFPSPGLFWLWEVAMGTHPKIARPRHRRTVASGATEWERRRSGFLHFGFGTCGPPEEEWAAEQGPPWGHLHIHAQFPTIDLLRPDGGNERLCEDGTCSRSTTIAYGSSQRSTAIRMSS